MYAIERTLVLVIPLAILVGMDTTFFLVSYSVLRVLRIPVRWVTLAIGWPILLASIVLTAFGLYEYNRFSSSFAALFGALSFGIAIYAVMQWESRRWYLVVKQGTFPWVAQQSRTFFLFMRQHHEFFGWIVFATASAHSILFLREASLIRFSAVWSGVIVWAVAALLSGFGLWLAYAAKQRRQFQRSRLIHMALGIAFFIALLIHIAAL